MRTFRVCWTTGERSRDAAPGTNLLDRAQDRAEDTTMAQELAVVEKKPRGQLAKLKKKKKTPQLPSRGRTRSPRR